MLFCASSDVVLPTCLCWSVQQQPVCGDGSAEAAVRERQGWDEEAADAVSWHQ